MNDRESLYQYGVAKLMNPSGENKNILINHLFRLKVNEDYVINTCDEVDELIQYLNNV